MTREQATAIIAPIRDGHSSRLDGPMLEGGGEVYWKCYHGTATLEGEFTADELEAIAIFMRENADPTRD